MPMRTELARLQEFPLIDGTGLDAIEAQARRVFGELRLDAPRESRPSKYKAVINYRGLKHVGLMYGSYSGALDARMGSRNEFVVGLMLSGCVFSRLAQSRSITDHPTIA
jgi:hypothetical protein